MEQKTILIVDDEPNLLSGITRNLHDQFEFETAATALEALDRLWHNPKIGVIMTDLRMPNMNGIELLIQVKLKFPSVVPLMLSGNADLSEMSQAVNEGHIFRFLTKPCPPDLLAKMLNAALDQRRLIESEKILLQKTLNGSVQVLVDILSMFDSEAFGQAQTLRGLSKYLAEQFDEDPWIVENAALLSHLSMVTIPTDLIQRYRSGDSLTVQEREIFQNIPKSSANLISQIPRLDVVAKTILYQRKHFNGIGFPNDKIAGSEIPFGSRILKGARDLLDLLQTGLKIPGALEVMQARVGEYDVAILHMIDICKETIEKQFFRKGVSTLKLSDMTKLRPGQLVKHKIETKNAVLIVREGVILQAALIEKITNFANLNILKLPIVIEEVEVVE